MTAKILKNVEANKEYFNIRRYQQAGSEVLVSTEMLSPEIIAAWVTYHAKMKDLAQLQLYLASAGIELHVGTMDLVIEQD